MDNTVNNISQNHYQAGTQTSRDIQKPANEKGERSAQASTNATEADRGRTDRVEISSRRSATVEPNPAVPGSRDEAVKLLEDTKGRLYAEAAIESQNPAQIHNLEPGGLTNLLA